MSSHFFSRLLSLAALLLVLGAPQAWAVCGDDVVEGYEECDGTSDSACPGACSSHCACPSMPPGAFEVHMIDIGQGDGLLVISPDGFTALFDAGKGSQDTVVEAYLTSVGVTEIDYTVVSHMHSDHMGAMDGIYALHPEIVVGFDSGASYGTNEYTEYVTAVGSRRTTVTPGTFIDMGPSMTVEVLHGDQGSGDENDNSVVVRLDYGTTSVLIGGDCTASCEASINPGLIDIYKVHHHGSATSSTSAFLNTILPETALISVGAGNSYGHPTSQALSNLSAVGATVYRTDLDGDIAVISDGLGYTVNGVGACVEGQTRACGTDVGECTSGVETCNAAGSWGACSGVPPVTELCSNSLDDDCDGMTDGADPDCGGGGTGNVVITQVGYDTPGTDSLEEYFDVYNPTAATVDLSGWTVSDGSSSWTFPVGSTVAPDTYASVARDTGGFQTLYGFTPQITGMGLALNNNGDVLVLEDNTATEVDRVAWEDFEPGWSITATTGLAILRADPRVDSDTQSDWSVASAVPQGGTTFCGGGGCGGGVSHVVFVEVAYEGAVVDAEREYFELYNPTGSVVDMSGWIIADDTNWRRVPPGITIGPGQLMTVARDPTGFEAAYGFAADAGPYYLSLGDGADRLALLDAGLNVVDFIAWEGYDGWSLDAPAGSALRRTDIGVDTDTEADWAVVTAGPGILP